MANCCFCYQEAGGDKYHEHCCKGFFEGDAAPALILDSTVQDSLGLDTIRQRIAVTGVQPKLPVYFQDQRLSIGLSGKYILKPPHPIYPMLPENEDLTMHLASLFQLETCEHALWKATGGQMIYLVKRMDRHNGSKIHMEDFCQLSELPTTEKYRGSYERIGKLVAKYCTDATTDLRRYFELVLFSYLTGNADMHLKNFSILHLDAGIRLSPAYDLLNVALANPADEDELALTLNARKRKIRLADFIVLANSLQIPVATRDDVFHQFVSYNTKVAALINASFLDETHKERYQFIWSQRQQIFQ
ncbi:HipA domain-containing protein [Chitinophaga polysaccharea]|uniref:HipA domain-containing protein n=1 Tax=Chitinophaga polysaccharea TaxID=1293035 RepID=UPI00145502CB|nr:HipA domain-containing protein [Chitinophaga polysaccharea]NLR62521.1 HipA domain-containing protein [Chitinophaga polysaccharea]